jgi:hypothetical protein
VREEARGLILVIGEDADGAARQRGRAGTKQPIDLAQIQEKKKRRKKRGKLETTGDKELQ